MKILKSFLLLLLFVAVPVMAATNDIVFSEDIIVTNITLGSDTTEMTVFASSSADSFDISGGVFTVTDPGGSFKMGSSNASVGTIVILESGIMESCLVNSIPGTSSTTLPSASGTYTIRPLENTSCSNLCSSLTGAVTYNAYPTCGAVTCASGYSLSGSGSGATCSVVSSSGGGGGGGSYRPPVVIIPVVETNESVIENETHEVSSDGTEIDTLVKITHENGVVVESKVEAILSVPDEIRDNQIIELDSSGVSRVRSLKLEFSPLAMESLVGLSLERELKVSIKNHKATSTRKLIVSSRAVFMVNDDIFSVDIELDGEEVKIFNEPLVLSFDVSSIFGGENLKIYYFNEFENKWRISGNGGVHVDGKIVIEVNHLTDFGLFQESEVVEDVVVAPVVDKVLSKREVQMLQIVDDANVVLLSSADLEIILIHNNISKSIEKQTFGMNNYIPKLTGDVSDLTVNDIYAINNFIVYGTITTRKLGAGERAGVVNSYKKAFNKLPITKEEWKDCISIGNGRWPGETNLNAEKIAKDEFKTIYLRDADMNNANDNAAVTVIAYGLRPDDRNTNSEKAGINIFKGIYKYNPVSALDWDIVRAISYSGAVR